MRNIILMGMMLFFITACTSKPKPKANISYVTIYPDDSEERKSLKTALSQYTDATVTNNVEKLVNFMYPKSFTIISKESMIEQLNKAYKSGKVPSVKNIKHLKLEPIQSYNLGRYSIITSSMTTVLNSPKADDEAFESYMLSLLQDKFASRGIVTLDKKKHQFNIQHTNKTIALKEKDSWKFIGFKQAKKYIEKGIFPKTLIEKVQ